MPPGDDGADLAAGYIARWRPSSVSPQAAAFARQVVPAGGAGRAGAGEEPAVGGGQARRLRDSARPGPGAGGAAAPVGDRAVHPVRAGRCPAWRGGRCARTCGSSAAGWCRSCIRQDMPLPRERAKAPYSPAEIAGYLALADAQPTLRGGCARAGLICLGAGAGLIRADLRAVHGTDVTCRSGGVIVAVRGARPRAVPVLARYHGRLLAAAAFAGTGLICGGTDPGRRNITTPLIRSLAGGAGLPRLDTSRLRATWLADVADLLGLATFMHAAGITCSQRLGDLLAGLEPAAEANAVRLLGAARPHDPAAGPGGDHRPLRHRAADRAAAAHRGPRPAAAGPHPAARHADRAGRPPARPPHPRPPGPGHPARGRPAAARRGRGLEARPAPADLPPDRADLRPRRGRAGQGHPRRAALRPAAAPLRRPARGIHPGGVQGRQHVAGRRLDRRGNLLPAPVPRHQRLRRPRSLLGTPLRRRPRPGQRAVLRLLPLRRHHDARGARPARPRAGPADDRLLLPPRPGPRPGPRAHRDARPRHRPRRHPGRLRLRPPRRRRLGPPAPAVRRASWSRTCTPPTAAPAAPTTAPSSPTATSTARPPPARCWNSHPWPATPPRNKPPPTTSRPPRPPATSSAGSPATTPTATTASPAPRPWARSAARSGPPP